MIEGSDPLERGGVELGVLVWLAGGVALWALQAWMCWRAILAASGAHEPNAMSVYAIAFVCVALSIAMLRSRKLAPTPWVILLVAGASSAALPQATQWAHRHLLEENRAALATWLAEEGVALEAAQGYSLSYTTWLPQASRHLSYRDHWSSVEVDRWEQEPAPRTGARGVVLEYVQADDSVRVDELQPLLHAHDLGVRGRDEVEWVALVYRSWPIEVTYGRWVAQVERVDLRLRPDPSSTPPVIQ